MSAIRNAALNVVFKVNFVEGFIIMCRRASEVSEESYSLFGFLSRERQVRTAGILASVSHDPRSQSCGWNGRIKP